MFRKLMWSAIPAIAIGTAAFASSPAPSQAVPLNDVRPVAVQDEPAESVERAEPVELASHRRGWRRGGFRGYRGGFRGYRGGFRGYRGYRGGFGGHHGGFCAFRG